MNWLHDIPPEKHHGILIGYKVRWGTSPSGSKEVGVESDSYNITSLQKYTSYTVYVAGRTNGGVGVERSKQVMTDEDSKDIEPFLFAHLGN